MQKIGIEEERYDIQETQNFYSGSKLLVHSPSPSLSGGMLEEDG